MLIGLLMANSLFVRTFFGSNEMRLNPGVFNALQFVLPVVMIFVELWIYDMVGGTFRYKSMDAKKDVDSPREGLDD